MSGKYLQGYQRQALGRAPLWGRLDLHQLRGRPKPLEGWWSCSSFGMSLS